MPLDAPSLSRALSRTPGASPEGLEHVHSVLCRREAPAFQRAARWLVSTQKADGSWANENRAFLENQSELATAFAVMAIAHCQ